MILTNQKLCLKGITTQAVNILHPSAILQPLKLCKGELAIKSKMEIKVEITTFMYRNIFFFLK